MKKVLCVIGMIIFFLPMLIGWLFVMLGAIPAIPFALLKNVTIARYHHDLPRLPMPCLQKPAVSYHHQRRTA